MYHSTRNPALLRAKLKRLRPTQLAVGYTEVELKASQWQRLGKRERKIQLEHHVFPAVVGPGKHYYIVDHHHLGIALMREGIDDIFVTVLDDMSWLELPVFWRTMEFRAWCHPYDHHGKRRAYRDLPLRLDELKDDPYRSLAGLVRDAGGYAKNEAPFVEFLWAEFFRPRVPARLINKQPGLATRKGLKLAHAREASYLPGWSGKS